MGGGGVFIDPTPPPSSVSVCRIEIQYTRYYIRPMLSLPMLVPVERAKR